MGQTYSTEYARLDELSSLITAVLRDANRLKELADAEVAANLQPTPGSSQAAYHAVTQHAFVLLGERQAIYRRMSCTVAPPTRRQCPSQRRLFQPKACPSHRLLFRAQQKPAHRRLGAAVQQD